MARADRSPRAASVDVDRRVVMVTGACPPDVCGVGDYTARVMAAAPASWRLLVERRWSMAAAPGIARRLFALAPTDVVIQYPTQGYGWSLIPHLLVVLGALTGRYRTILALHEFSSLSPKSRLPLALASHFAAHVVFTTEVERDRARAHRFFARRVPTSVIGILSNIPRCDHPPAYRDRTIDIAYFGHIRPNKGLESFLDVMDALRRADPAVRIAVIGEIPAGYEEFATMVASRCRAIDCEMILGLDDDAAGRALADTKILYLPFRDGVSARRGSVLAGFGNGTLVATSVGMATVPALLPAIVACLGTTDDVDTLRRTLRLGEEDVATLREAGRAYVANVLPRDWPHVVALYARAIADGDTPGQMVAC